MPSKRGSDIAATQRTSILSPSFKLQLFGDSGWLLQVIFDFDHELVHRAAFAGRHAVFDDFGKAVQDLLDGVG